LYQHAEHYFRINNARREGNQQATAPRPSTPADVEMNSSEADSREVDRFEPQWDGEDTEPNLSQPGTSDLIDDKVGSDSHARQIPQCQSER
jgi:hypothetical protein